MTTTAKKTDLLARVRLPLSKVETRLHELARQTLGLRILDRFGWTLIARWFFAANWLISLGLVATTFRPDLLHPSAIGSDTSNYVAAAERLATSGEIYSIHPGDRPVPLDNPPEWSAPILSPPTVPLVNVWLVALPDGWRLYPTWLVGLIGTVAVGFLVAAFAPPLFLGLGLQYMPGLAIMAWSGNVNALIAPALLIAFFGIRSRSPGAQALAGSIVAVATAIKLGPAIVAFWVICQGRRPATIALFLTGIGFGVLTIGVTGWSSISQYLHIASESAGTPTGASVPGILHAVGVPTQLATLAIPVVLLGIVVLVARFRESAAAFLLAVTGSIFATTVVRYDSVALWLAPTVVWLGRGLLLPPRPELGPTLTRERTMPPWSAVLAAIVTGSIVGAGALSGSIASGGLTTSTFGVSNTTDQVVIARLNVPNQEASFGFAVPPASSIVGWESLGAVSPTVASIWSANCAFIGSVDLPKQGGQAVVSSSGVTLRGPGVPARHAPYSSNCALEFERRLRSERPE